MPYSAENGPSDLTLIYTEAMRNGFTVKSSIPTTQGGCVVVFGKGIRTLRSVFRPDETLSIARLPDREILGEDRVQRALGYLRGHVI